MASIDSQTAIKLAQNLPRRLQNFFSKFPPGAAYATGPQRPRRTATALSPSPSPSPSPSQIAPTEPSDSSPEERQEPARRLKYVRTPSPRSDPTYNPFQPWRNPLTGRWREPMYGLRRQADIAKLARNFGVEELLPHSSKLSWVRAAKREQGGLRVKGTGVGQKVKGKEWERTQKGRLEKRRVAMLGMDDLIRQWEERGHGRGWKKWPK